MLPVDRVDLFEGHEEQQAVDARADGSLGDSEVRRLQQDPYQAQQQALGHEDYGCHEQVFGECHTDGAGNNEEGVIKS